MGLTTCLHAYQHPLEEKYGFQRSVNEFYQVHQLSIFYNLFHIQMTNTWKPWDKLVNLHYYINLYGEWIMHFANREGIHGRENALEAYHKVKEEDLGFVAMSSEFGYLDGAKDALGTLFGDYGIDQIEKYEETCNIISE